MYLDTEIIERETYLAMGRNLAVYLFIRDDLADSGYWNTVEKNIFISSYREFLKAMLTHDNLREARKYNLKKGVVYPDAESGDYRRRCIQRFRYELTLNKRLQGMVRSCEKRLLEKESLGQSMPLCPTKTIYKDFPRMFLQQTEEFQPLTVLCRVIHDHYDLNLDHEYRLYHYGLFLEEHGLVNDEQLREIEDAPLSYLPSANGFNLAFIPPPVKPSALASVADRLARYGAKFKIKAASSGENQELQNKQAEYVTSPRSPAQETQEEIKTTLPGGMHLEEDVYIPDYHEPLDLFPWEDFPKPTFHPEFEPDDITHNKNVPNVELSPDTPASAKHTAVEPVVPVKTTSTRNTTVEHVAPVKLVSTRNKAVELTAPVKPASTRDPAVERIAPVVPTSTRDPAVELIAPVVPTSSRDTAVELTAPVKPASKRDPAVELISPVVPTSTRDPAVELIAPVVPTSTRDTAVEITPVVTTSTERPTVEITPAFSLPELSTVEITPVVSTTSSHTSTVEPRLVSKTTAVAHAVTSQSFAVPNPVNPSRFIPDVRPSAITSTKVKCQAKIWKAEAGQKNVPEVKLVGTDRPHVYENRKTRLQHSGRENSGVMDQFDRKEMAAKRLKVMGELEQKRVRMTSWLNEYSDKVAKQSTYAFKKVQKRKRDAIYTSEYFKRANKGAKLTPHVATTAPDIISKPRVVAPVARAANKPKLVLKLHKSSSDTWTATSVLGTNGKRSA